MERVTGQVKTGLITNAVRDTKMNGNSIKKDDLIGIYESDIVANGKEPVSYTHLDVYKRQGWART